ncbi:MAG: AzlC family ABC transporter permease [Pseudomonadota bacterium]
MAPSTAKSAYARGVTDSLPFLLIVAPFAMVFGIVATEAGLSVAQVMGFSVLVIAGAAQLTAIQLMVEGAPTTIVIVTALAVNLRMAMYSASLAPFLGPAPLWQRAAIAFFNVDQAYALSIAKYQAAPEMSVPVRVAYFAGLVTPVAPIWYMGSLAGATLNAAIPQALTPDFAVPIAFLAIIAPMVRTVAHLAAALVSIFAALALAWLPLGLGLLVAAMLAMATGAEVERRLGERPL